MDCAFDVPSTVLKYTMNGQMWPAGGEDFHLWINVPTLIIHGEQDKLISLEEEQEMLKVKCSILISELSRFHAQVGHKNKPKVDFYDICKKKSIKYRSKLNEWYWALYCPSRC